MNLLKGAAVAAIMCAVGAVAWLIVGLIFMYPGLMPCVMVAVMAVEAFKWLWRSRRDRKIDKKRMMHQAIRRHKTEGKG